MKTKILKPTEKNLKIAAKKILSGGVVCYPTDTIYGLATNPFCDHAVKKIFEIKGRDENKPIIVLIPKNFDLENFVEISDKAKKIIEKYWPGPLTIVFKAKQKFSNLVSAGLDTIALRMPNNPVTLKLLELAGPITSTSANISGQETINNPQKLKQIFNSKLEIILDGGMVENQVASTLLDLTGEKPKILRQGSLILSEQDLN